MGARCECVPEGNWASVSLSSSRGAMLPPDCCWNLSSGSIQLLIRSVHTRAQTRTHTHSLSLFLIERVPTSQLSLDWCSQGFCIMAGFVLFPNLLLLFFFKLHVTTCLGDCLLLPCSTQGQLCLIQACKFYQTKRSWWLLLVLLVYVRIICFSSTPSQSYCNFSFLCWLKPNSAMSLVDFKIFCMHL